MTATRQAVALAVPLLAWDAHVLVFCNLIDWPAMCALLAPLMPVRELLVWHQQKAARGIRAPSGPEDGRQVIVHASTASERTADLDTALQRASPVVMSVRSSPATRSPDLLVHLIEQYCPLDGLVLDLFAGSGSTLAAAQRLRRRAVGVEGDARLFAVAARRLQTTRSRTKPPDTSESQPNARVLLRVAIGHATARPPRLASSPRP